MKKQMIRLTESELHQIIEESVKAIITENMEQEGWYDKMKAGAGAFFKSPQAAGGLNLGKRMEMAKKNFNSRGKFDDLRGLISQLQALVDAKKIDANVTVGELLGNKGVGGKLRGMAINQASQMKSRGYQLPKK